MLSRITLIASSQCALAQAAGRNAYYEVFGFQPLPPLFGAAFAIRPNLPPLADPSALAWNRLGLERPNPFAYRMPVLPPFINPALARASIPLGYPAGPNPGIANLVYFDPRIGPAPNTVPLIAPAQRAYPGPGLIGPPSFSRDAEVLNFAPPRPMPASYEELRPESPQPPPWLDGPSMRLSKPLVVDYSRDAAGPFPVRESRPLVLLPPVIGPPPFPPTGAR